MPRTRTKPRGPFGERLARLRQEAGFTQRELAKELGVTQRTITYYELDAERLPSDFLIDLSRLLGVSVDYILGLEDEPRAKSGPRNRRLRKQLEVVDQLPGRTVSTIIDLIDAIIARHEAEQEGDESE